MKPDLCKLRFSFLFSWKRFSKNTHPFQVILGSASPCRSSQKTVVSPRCICPGLRCLNVSTGICGVSSLPPFRPCEVSLVLSPIPLPDPWCLSRFHLPPRIYWYITSGIQEAASASAEVFFTTVHFLGSSVCVKYPLWIN